MIEVKEENGYKFIPCGDGSLAQGIIEIDNPDKILSPFVEYCVHKINELPDGCDVLILGLGTGSIPKAVRNGIYLDIVEIDPEMIKVAKQHFGYKPSFDHIIEMGDARELVDIYSKFLWYDLVIVDLFGSEVPKFARESVFYNQLALLTNKVIVNEISVGLEDPKFDYGNLWEIDGYDIGNRQLWWEIVVLDKIK